MAADELEAWELSAMRDPRNWARPAAALVAGSAAGTALVLLRARRRAARPLAAGSTACATAAERAMRDLARETPQAARRALSAGLTLWAGRLWVPRRVPRVRRAPACGAAASG